MLNVERLILTFSAILDKNRMKTALDLPSYAIIVWKDEILVENWLLRASLVTGIESVSPTLNLRCLQTRGRPRCPSKRVDSTPHRCSHCALPTRLPSVFIYLSRFAFKSFSLDLLVLVSYLFYFVSLWLMAPCRARIWGCLCLFFSS